MEVKSELKRRKDEVAWPIVVDVMLVREDPTCLGFVLQNTPWFLGTRTTWDTQSIQFRGFASIR